MKIGPFLWALSCLIAVFACRLTAQVLTKPNSGLTTAEGIQIANTNQPLGPPNYNLSFLSAQDVDGDGKLDLIAGLPSIDNGQPVTYSVLHNLGDFNFHVSSFASIVGCLPSYTNPLITSSVLPFCILADLNGDGLPDEIFASETPNASKPTEIDKPIISVAFATSPGTYGPSSNYIVGASSSYISSVTTGDFNGDGLTDIAVLRMPQIPPPGTSLLIADIVLMIANGHGGFNVSAPIASGVIGGPPFHPQLAALDLNGDGKSDLIVYDSYYGSPVGVFFGAASGLSKQSNLPFQNKIFHVEVAADLNHDGYGDIVAFEDDGVHILLGSPGGRHYGYFSSDQLLRPSDAFDYQLENVVTGDFNGDGLPDLAISTLSGVTIYQQASNGLFTRLQEYPGGGLLAVGDFNGDHKLDLAVGGNPINILYGQGNGYFNGPAITNNHGQPGPVVTADFNHDGIPDIASTWNGKCTPELVCSNFLSIFLGTGKGWFQPPVSYPIPLSSGPLPGIVLAVGDLNGDGIPDIVAVEPPEETLPSDTAVFLGKSDGTFSAAKVYTLGDHGNGIVYLRDMDNDGKLDLVVNFGIAYGNGDGTFGQVTSYPIGVVGGLAVADLNHDGRMDLLANQGEQVIVLMGAPGRKFRISQTISPSCVNDCSFGLTLAIGELNKDGKPDFVALANGEMFTYLGNGNGTFHESGDWAVSSFYPNVPPYYPVSIQDMNGDGIPDVILAPGGGIMPVYLGRGDGSLAAPIIFAVEGSHEASAAFPAFGYFNPGRGLDMITPAEGGFARLLNTGYGTWPALASLPKAPAP